MVVKPRLWGSVKSVWLPPATVTGDTQREIYFRNSKNAKLAFERDSFSIPAALEIQAFRARARLLTLLQSPPNPKHYILIRL